MGLAAGESPRHKRDGRPGTTWLSRTTGMPALVFNQPYGHVDPAGVRESISEYPSLTAEVGPESCYGAGTPPQAPSGVKTHRHQLSTANWSQNSPTAGLNTHLQSHPGQRGARIP